MTLQIGKIKFQHCLLVFILTLMFACQPVSIDDERFDSSIEEIDRQASNGKPKSDDLPVANPATNSSFTILDNVTYKIQQHLKLVNSGPGSPIKQNLWVALISDDHPYQKVIERKISPGDFRVITDEHGNQIAEFDFSGMPPNSEILVTIDYRIEVNQLHYDLSDCIGELPDFYTSAELHVESENPQIVSLSEELASDQKTTCDQVRAFYDYLGNELVYSYNGGNWGAQAALGKMGADCTEYASLMIALSRAAGIPARYIEGLNFNPKGGQEPARLEHAWLEVFLPGIGWTPMDPTMGRSPLNRGFYFGKLPPDHIIVSRGRNPSTLRGASYWTYIYWPGNSADIKIEEGDWEIVQLED